MICCYLIFSGLCKNSDEAIEYYGLRRTFDNKGVTIASQIRYIKYFETFLMTNFSTPYISMLPQIINKYLNDNTTNILQSFIDNPNSYFITPNKFQINYIRIGPFDSKKILEMKVNDFIGTKFNFKDNEKRVEEENGNYYYKEVFRNNNSISSDLKIKVSALTVKFLFLDKFMVFYFRYY